MKRIILIIWFVLFSSFAYTISIDGHAFLEDQTDHSGITVTFLRLNPFSSFSTSTDASGYYKVQLEDRDNVTNSLWTIVPRLFTLVLRSSGDIHMLKRIVGAALVLSVLPPTASAVLT